MNSLSEVIDAKPDIVIVEFGMNDHVIPDSLSTEMLESFRVDMNNIVNSLQDAGIDVILVGFFQQNDVWELENITATDKYNFLLESIAKENNVYFADIRKKYMAINKVKNIYEDVTADYMHHPSVWGHMIYMSEILPVFNIDGKMRPVDINGYVN